MRASPRRCERQRGHVRELSADMDGEGREEGTAELQMREAGATEGEGGKRARARADMATGKEGPG